MASLTINTQDVYPPRKQIVVSGLTVGDSVEIYRIVSNTRTLVRGGVTESVNDTSFIAVDSEFPFGVPVTYEVFINGSNELSEGPTTFVLANGKPVFTDAINGNAAEMIIKAWDRKSRVVQSSVFVVGGRNVGVASGSLSGYEADIEVYTDASSSADNFLSLIRNATGNIIQARNANGKVADYWFVRSVEEQRLEQDIDDDKTVFVLNVVEVNAWADALIAKAYTYQDVADFYAPSGTYADAASDYATYLAAIQGDYL